MTRQRFGRQLLATVALVAVSMAGHRYGVMVPALLLPGRRGWWT